MGLWGVDSSLDSDVTKKNTDISMSLRPRSLTPRLGTLNELLWAELHRTAADSNGLSQKSELILLGYLFSGHHNESLHLSLYTQKTMLST